MAKEDGIIPNLPLDGKYYILKAGSLSSANVIYWKPLRDYFSLEVFLFLSDKYDLISF